MTTSSSGTTISSGVTSSFLTITNGMVLDVYGTVISTTISSGGQAFILAGGIAEDSILGAVRK
jgi:hypothetical protein